MTRTPDEIKKGLEEEIPVHYHIDGEPRLTPRMLMDMQWLHKDAIALIQQLQAENAKKDARIQQIEAERDALMHWAKDRCDTCAHNDDCVKHDPDPEGYVMHWYDDCEIWEWRGVQKEE